MNKQFTEVDSIVIQYIDFDGKEYAVGKVFVPGFNYIQHLWYINNKGIKQFLKQEHLVEVDRVSKHINKPAFRIFADKKNPLVLMYRATLDIHGEDHSVTGFCLSLERAMIRANRKLARMSRLSFEAVNEWLKHHPTTFKIEQVIK